MRNFILLFTMVLFAGMASAQTCSKTASKSCCAKKAATTAEATAVNVNEGQVASLIAEADALAASNDAIERRQCAESGKVAYYQKNVCPTSGHVTNEEVMYDVDSKAFVKKVAAATMEADAVKGEAAPAKAACTSGKTSCAKSCGAKKGEMKAALKEM